MADVATGAWRTLLVGGAGYLGARLAEALLSKGQVVITSRVDSPARTQWCQSCGGGLSRVPFDSNLQEALPVTGEFDLVVNLAMPGAAEAASGPEGARARATRATRAVMTLMTEGRAGRLIHFSTFHVYGAHGQKQVLESDELRPTQPYGQIHAACETMVRTAAGGAPSFLLRPTNVVGSPAHADLGDQARLLFLNLCRQAATLRSLKLGSDGSGWRDFLTMADLVAAVKLLAIAPMAAGQAVLAVNVAHGRAGQVADLAHAIQTVAAARYRQKIELSFGTAGDTFRAPFTVNHSRLRELGWVPTCDLQQEIQATLEFFERSP